MMTLEQIRAVFIDRMSAWTGIPASDIDYPNNPKGPFDPTGKAIWARLGELSAPAAATEIGKGPCVRRDGRVTIQLFVPSNKGTLAITKAADTLVEHFQFYTDPAHPFDCFAVSMNTLGDDGRGWYQVNLNIPYRAY